MDHQQSRPPSVDSVNLGSTYSGFFPYSGQQQQHHSLPHMSSTGAAGLLPSQYHHPSHHQYSQQQPQAQNQQQQMYSNHHLAQQPQQQPNLTANYGLPPSTTPLNSGTVPYPSSTSSGPEGMNYQFTLSAAAAAAAAAAVQFSRNQANQGLPPAGNPAAGPQQTQHSGYVGDAGQAYPQQIYSTTNQHLQHQQQAQQLQTYPSQRWPQPQQQQPPQYNAQANLYYSQYASGYYLEYYRRFWAMHHMRQAQAQAQTKTPLKYGSRLVHARAVFSQNINQLMVVQSRTQIAFYELRELFIDRCYPSLYLQSLLSTVSSEPGKQTLLPFNDVQVALEWIRIKSINDSNYELKLVLKVLNMLYRQNGTVSGLDLSELLYETVSGAQLNESLDQSSNLDKLSTSGSERASREQLQAHLRQLLMRGQKGVAIAFAQNNGLYDHAMSLVFLTTFQAQSGSPASAQVDNALMISTIRRFITSTLETTDPMYVFYSHLLQIITNQVNSLGGQPIPSTATGKIESLESLIILLANDINFDKVEIVNNSLKNLIDLMIALLKNDYDYVLPDELFSEPFDCLLVNECLEFARFSGKHYNQRLLLRKLEFAFELFDFGFVPESINYCELILKSLKHGDFDLKKITSVDGNPFKASRLQSWLVPSSKLTGSEDDVRDMIVKLWSYQIIKLLSRNDQIQPYDSPLIVLPPDPEPSSSKEDSESTDETSEESVESEPEPVKVSKKKSKSNQKKAESSSKDKQTVHNNNKKDNIKVATLKLDAKKKKTTAKTTTVKDAKEKKTKKSLSKSDSYKEQSQSESRATSGTDNDDSRDDINEEPSFSTQLSSTVEQDQSGRMLAAGDLTMSPIETNKSRTSSFSQPLRETMIGGAAQVQPQQPPPMMMNVQEQPQQQQPNAFTSPFGQQMDNGPFGSQLGASRPLNPIAESRSEDSIGSTPASSLPQSPSHRVPAQLSPQSSFDLSSGNATVPSLPNTSFNISGPFGTMNVLEQSLPNGDISQVDSGPQSGFGQQQQNSNQQPQQPPMFAPPISYDSSQPAFDFLSTGQVTSIPSYDPVDKFPGNSSDAAGDHLQNQNHSRQDHKHDNDKNKKDSGSNKSSPSKNNGGLFSSLLGKFKSNQIILPDDKNPTIVFDPETKQWIDKDAGGAAVNAPPPPPIIPLKSSQFGGGQQPGAMTQQPQGPPPPSGAAFNQADLNQSASGPNSTLTSPVNPNIPMSKSFHSLPNNGPLVPPFGPGSGPAGPAKPGLNRKNRYVDAWK